MSVHLFPVPREELGGEMMQRMAHTPSARLQSALNHLLWALTIEREREGPAGCDYENCEGIRVLNGERPERERNAT